MTTVNKPAVKAMATALAAALCAQLAYAVTPTAVWSGNLGQSYTIDGKTYKFSIYDGVSTLNQDGTLTVANAWTGYPSPYIDISATGATSVSVLVKFSGLSLPVTSDYGVCIADMMDSDNIDVGACIEKNATALSAFHMVENSPTQNRLNGSDNAVIGSGYMLYSYSTTGGVKAYMGSSIANLVGGENTGFKFGNKTISRVAVGGEAKAKYYEPSGVTIEEVALFVNDFYSASDVANYEFPAKIYSSDVNVSTINSDFPNASEIDVYLADGVTVTGDTTFTATKVNFHCYGSFNMTPPANNEATFDFVQGHPVLIYSALPAVSGTKFTSTVIPSFVTDPAQWTGTIYISSATVTDFTSNPYGNESSVVRLGNVSGWLRAPGNYAFTNTVPVELVGTLTIDNGNSARAEAPNKCALFKKVSGGGTINTDSTGSGAVIVIQDASEFTGSLGLNYGKFIVFGETMPDYTTVIKNTTVGTIFVMPGVKVTNRGFWWATGGIKVDGELCAPNHADYFGGGTTITTSDTGVFTLTNTSNINDTNTDYGKITGTGTLKYESASNWRTVSTSNFPTNMIVQNELGDGLILQNVGATYTIGSLSGSKKIRTDMSTGDRDLRILQAKDTTYSGLFDDARDRMGTVTVAPGTSTAGTLTLSGEQRATNNLVVEAGAKVNITGTWVGATTVNGTLSGTGTVSGAVTLANGSTLAANTADPLTVSSLTATGTVTIGLADSDIGKVFISSTGAIDTTGATFAFTVDGEPTHLSVIKTAGGLKAVRPGLKIIFR